MLASSIMDDAAAFLNDTAKSNFTYTVQIPYLNIALTTLQETMAENNVPITNETSAIIVVPAGVLSIGGTGLTDPPLPTDLVEIQGIYERSSGVNEDYTRIVKVEFLPMTVYQSQSLGVWAWEGDVIRFIGATEDRDVKIDYIADVITAVTSSTDTIGLRNCKSYLAYKTASLCALYIGENETRAAELNQEAEGGKGRFLNINTKGRQAIATRRRPFMSGSRSYGGIR